MKAWQFWVGNALGCAAIGYLLWFVFELGRASAQ